MDLLCRVITVIWTLFELPKELLTVFDKQAIFDLTSRTIMRSQRTGHPCTNAAKCFLSWCVNPDLFFFEHARKHENAVVLRPWRTSYFFGICWLMSRSLLRWDKVLEGSLINVISSVFFLHTDIKLEIRQIINKKS